MRSSDPLFQNKVIILGNNNHNTLGLIRSFGEIGIFPYAILYGCDRKSFVAHSKYIRKSFFASSPEEGVNLLSTLFGNESLKPFVFCPNDKIAELFDDKYDLLESHFYLQNAGKRKALYPFFDKYIQCVSASKWGFDVLKTELVDRNDIEYSSVCYPCIVKPSRSTKGIKKDIAVCKNEIELRKSIAKLSSECTHVIIQRFVEKEYEVSVLGVALKNEVVIPGLIKKLREKPVGGGNSSFASLLPIPDDFDTSPIVKAVREIGYLGLFSVELVKKNNHYYFLEFNFRNDGNGYVITSSGVNEPLLFCLDQLNLKYEINTPNTPHYFMSIGDAQHIRNGLVSFRQWFSDYRTTNCFLQCNDLDPVPKGNTRYMIIVALRAKLLNLIGK